jgi:hypothetical protein
MRNKNVQIVKLLEDASVKTDICVSLDASHSITGEWIPLIGDLYEALDKGIREQIEEVLVHKTKSGIVRLKLRFDVEKRDGTVEPAGLIALLKPSSVDNHTALFRGPIRVINDENTASAPNICAAVFIIPMLGSVANGLHTFLRLTEGPAHLEWRTQGSGSRPSKYNRPTHLPTFIKGLIPKFVEAANAVTKSKPLGMGFITMPLKGAKKGSTSSGGTGGGGGGGGGTRKDVPELSESRSAGETTFKFTTPNATFDGKQIVFESSYEAWTGSSWSKAATAEFDMKNPGGGNPGTHPLTINGCNIVAVSNNSVTVEITDANIFSIKIQGFDWQLERVHRYDWV